MISSPSSIKPSIPSHEFPLSEMSSSLATCSSRPTCVFVSARCCSNPARSSGLEAALAIFGRALTSCFSASYVSCSSNSSRSRSVEVEAIAIVPPGRVVLDGAARRKGKRGAADLLLLDAKVPDREERAEVIPGQRLAGALEPVHHAHDPQDRGTDLLDFSDRLEHAPPGC